MKTVKQTTLYRCKRLLFIHGECCVLRKQNFNNEIDSLKIKDIQTVMTTIQIIIIECDVLNNYEYTHFHIYADWQYEALAIGFMANIYFHSVFNNIFWTCIGYYSKH